MLSRLARSAVGHDEEIARFEDARALCSLPVVRREVARFLAHSPIAVGQDVADDAVLCADELITNSLVHTASRVISLNVCVRTSSKRGAVVRVVVGDEDRRRPGRGASCKSELSTRGRGLPLLTALSQWGCRRCSHGKDVWFECPRPAAQE
ncbi:ATP-binding protein [Actinocrinis puniceicyclus]|uniref:ATP-binding protein n=1 Tax=Actinocrinis puniceicyclus TaxID=977794 RepID=A0A8J7WSM1_9ACTN|nr:ATP-binding protein [Actinocrinis puniceicyclus]MBS2966020.1 ATP-binding protein [Actinocrinis puniceicyclus]